MNVVAGTSFGIFLYVTALPVSLSLANIALGLLCLFGITTLLSQKKTLPIPPSFLCIFIFFTWAIICQSKNEGVFRLSHLNTYGKIWNFLPFLFLPIFTWITEDKKKKVLKVLMILASAVTILGAIQYWTHTHYFFEGWFNKGNLVANDRFFGFQSYPLHTAGLYSILFCVALSLSVNSSHLKNEKIFWAIASITMALAVLLTGSRSYYLGVAAGTILILSFQKRKIFIGIAALSLLGILLIGKSAPYLQERLKTTLPFHADESGRQRIYAWKCALKMIYDHPIFGVGYRKWGENLPHYAQRFPEWKMDPAIKGHAHNSILTVASETGLVGLVLIVLFWLAFLKEEISLLKNSHPQSFSYALSLGVVAATFNILTASSFEHNIFTAIPCLTLFFMSGLNRLKEEKIS